MYISSCTASQTEVMCHRHHGIAMYDNGATVLCMSLCQLPHVVGYTYQIESNKNIMCNSFTPHIKASMQLSYVTIVNYLM